MEMTKMLTQLKDSSYYERKLDSLNGQIVHAKKKLWITTQGERLATLSNMEDAYIYMMSSFYSDEYMNGIHQFYSDGIEYYMLIIFPERVPQKIRIVEYVHHKTPSFTIESENREQFKRLFSRKMDVFEFTDPISGKTFKSEYDLLPDQMKFTFSFVDQDMGKVLLLNGDDVDQVYQKLFERGKNHENRRIQYS